MIEAGIVEFAGHIKDQDLRALIAAADVQVIPSIYEPFGLVALEAAALFTPIITTKTGGLSDIARSDYALTFAPETPTELAQAIQQSLTDPAAGLERATRLGKRLSTDYAWTTIATQTQSAYRQAQSNSARPAIPELGLIPTHNLLQ